MKTKNNRLKEKKYMITIKKTLYDNNIYEPHHEISHNVVCATSKASDQPAHMRRVIRAFACRLNIL